MVPELCNMTGLSDEQRANFKLMQDMGALNSLKKVGPSLGMTVGNPKEFKLTDNRPATYVQTLDQVIKMGPSIIMVVIPNNKVIELSCNS